MKLVHSQFPCQIEMKENRVSTIVIESPTLFSQVISQWIKTAEGTNEGWVLSHNGIIIPFEKKMDIILEPYTLDINQRKIIARLYEIVQADVNESSLLIEWHELQSLINIFSQNLVEQVDYCVEAKIEVDLKEVLKLVDFKFARDHQTLAEKILDYILIRHQVLRYDVFVLINIKMYLESCEIDLLIKRLAYEKIYVLMLEGHDRVEKLENEDVVVVDKESCIIYK